MMIAIVSFSLTILAVLSSETSWVVGLGGEGLDAATRAGFGMEAGVVASMPPRQVYGRQFERCFHCLHWNDNAKLAEKAVLERGSFERIYSYRTKGGAGDERVSLDRGYSTQHSTAQTGRYELRVPKVERAEWRNLDMEEKSSYKQYRTTNWFCGDQTDRKTSYPTGAAARPGAWAARWLLVAGAGAGAEVLLPRHQICHVNKSAGWGWVPSSGAGTDPNHR